ncbi:MAG: hypothetical protein AAGJ79_07655 [Verrucomicrobiota bacterium]
MRKNLKSYEIDYGYFHGRAGVSARILEFNSTGEAKARCRSEWNSIASVGRIEPTAIQGKSAFLGSEPRFDGRMDSYLYFQGQNLVFRFASPGEISKTSLQRMSAAEIVLPLRHDREFIAHPYEPRIKVLWEEHFRERLKSVGEFFNDLLWSARD